MRSEKRLSEYERLVECHYERNQIGVVNGKKKLKFSR